jgi:hypothetical protein
MPERTAEDIRKEIAVERQSLADDLDVLHAEARSLVPVAVAGVVGVVLLSQRKRIASGVRFLWRLV